MQIASQLANWAVPFFFALTVTVALLKKQPVFDQFAVGAKEGIHSCVRLLPTLIGLIMAVNMLKASGFFDVFSSFISPVTEKLGVPGDLVVLLLLRPVSGSGATAYVNSLFSSLGPDSLQGRMASVLCASTETTVYVVTVYLGAAGCKKSGKCIPAGLCGDCMAAFLSILLVRLFG